MRLADSHPQGLRSMMSLCRGEEALSGLQPVTIKDKKNSLKRKEEKEWKKKYMDAPKPQSKIKKRFFIHQNLHFSPQDRALRV